MSEIAASPNIARVEQDTLELSQNVSYGVVSVGRLMKNGNSACQNFRKYQTDTSTFNGDTSKHASSDHHKKFHYQYTKILRWIFGCFSALVVANIISVIALVVAFTMITSLKSDIESRVPESSTAEVGNLESKLNQLNGDIRSFLLTSISDLTELRESTSKRVNSLGSDLTSASDLAKKIPALLNNTYEKISTQTNQLNIRIDELSANVTSTTMTTLLEISDEAGQIIRTTEQIVNSSAIQLATDIRSLHVFKSCEIVSVLKLSFPSGTYRIGSSLVNSSLMNCGTTTALTCNGISGQWRRVAYLFSSDGLPYSPVCGRVHGTYYGTPDAFEPYQNSRTSNPTIEDNYVDGVSLTYGTSPRKHVWTFSVSSVITNPGCKNNCNCHFVGPEYTCQKVPGCGRPGASPPDVTCEFPKLWNGNQCVGGDLFYRNLTKSTTENLEMRLCRDQIRWDEDVYLTFVEIFVTAT